MFYFFQEKNSQANFNLKVACDTFLPGRALKQSNIKIKHDSKIKQVCIILITRELLTDKKRLTLQALTLVGATYFLIP